MVGTSRLRLPEHGRTLPPVEGIPVINHDIAHATPHHPAVLREIRVEAGDVQLRMADQITRFAGSMLFVYLHVGGFALWILLAEGSPWPTLTLIDQPSDRVPRTPWATACWRWPTTACAPAPR